MRRFPRSVLFWLDLALKAVLFGLLIVAVAFPNLPQFEGKAMLGRAIAYPIAVMIAPVASWLVRRRRPASTYPYGVDILITLPFLIDVAGNALDLYDSISWWDDLNHFVNWGLLVGGFALLLRRLPIGRSELAALAIGFGAVTAIVWELLEYVTFIRNSSELATAYTDTLGDLSLGLGGSIVAALLVASPLLRRGRAGSAAAN
ncbi:MAG: hypothetical protein WBQ14_07820 [Gaiellaceae bacterium]